ncbi:MAG: zinc-binding alcohol dehydrogenase family protein [Actinobacteria bacterium]|nr:zinc-binding alcohol dehydrogenase family protein [Actinomycetota bacterium]MCB9413472.1 zinc-binding alcohol dehydrogenase family protein [Actinomycetota bacterium]
MRAVGFREPLGVDEPECLIDFEVDDPEPTGHDLLVEIRAISVNPVDTKIRRAAPAPDGGPRILGWDAAGVVRAVGEHVELFAPGDEVWYAGDLTRPGTNAELHLVDERIVGRKPRTLDFAAAAALPLTAITAWELLFDRLGVPKSSSGVGGGSLLIIGAAGGVGSILTQLAAQLTDLTVVGTASRPESADWVRSMGADHVIDHSRSMAEQLDEIGMPQVTYVASLTHSADHFPTVVELLAPQGKYGLIDDPAPGAIDINALKRKSASLHWEFMFTRSMFGTDDMVAQHHLLDEVADLVDGGILRSTGATDGGVVNASNLIAAHTLLESGRSVGKLTLAGF